MEYFSGFYLVAEHDPAQTSAITFDFKAPEASALAPRYEIDVNVEGSDPWVGSVYGGLQGMDGVVALPNPMEFACIAGGVGYRIPADSPSEYNLIPIQAIRDVVCSVEAQKVIFIGWTGVLALGFEASDQWEAKGLVSDGFTSFQATSENLVLRGFFAPTNSDIEITLDLFTGRELER